MVPAECGKERFANAVIFTLSNLRRNYKKSGKLIEAKAIDQAIYLIRKEGKKA